MPAGAEVTDPLPVPLLVTVNVVAIPNVALTERAAVSVKVHTALTLVQPAHASNTYPEPGVAVSITAWPLAYSSEQSPGHAMPPGLDATEPTPEVVVVSR